MREARREARAAAHVGELVRGLVADRAAAAMRGTLAGVDRTIDPWTLAARIVDGGV